MPNTTKLHVDKLLSNVSVRYANSEYVWDKVWPKVMMKTTSDTFRQFERNFRIPETLRAIGAESREMDFDISSGSLNLEKHSLRRLVADDQQDNYDIADLRRDTTEELTDAIYRMAEKKVADLFTTTTSWSLNVTLAAAAQWTLQTTASNPIQQLDTGATEIIQNSGAVPNFAIVPRDSFIAAKHHVSVLDRVKYTSKEMSKQIMAGLFEVSELLVPTAVYDTVEEGITASISALWADNAFIGYKPASAGYGKLSCGYNFMKDGPRVKRWREEAREGEFIECTIHFLPRIVASLTGFLIRDTNG